MDPGQEWSRALSDIVVIMRVIPIVLVRSNGAHFLRLLIYTAKKKKSSAHSDKNIKAPNLI